MEYNPTGVCIIGKEIRVFTLFKTEDIVNALTARHPLIVAVDAPLTREDGPFRDCERALLKKGYRPLPLTMRTMEALFYRASELKGVLERYGIKTIETFVPAMRCKIVDLKRVRNNIGIKNRHERDAFLCALAAMAYLEGRSLSYGEKNKIYVVEKEYVKEKVRELGAI